MTLYEIAESMVNAIEFGIDPETGEILDDYDLSKKVDEIEMTLDDKIDNISKYIVNLVSDEEELEKQEKKFKERKESLKKKREKLQAYLDVFLRMMFTNKETCELDVNALKKYCKNRTSKAVSIGYRESSSVEVVNIDNIPEEFVNTKPTRSPIKADIKKYLESVEKENESKSDEEKVVIEWAKISNNLNMSVK